MHQDTATRKRPSTRTREWEKSQVTPTRQPRIRVGAFCAPRTKPVQFPHNSRKFGWTIESAHRRVCVCQAHAWVVKTTKIARVILKNEAICRLGIRLVFFII